MRCFCYPVASLCVDLLLTQSFEEWSIITAMYKNVIVFVRSVDYRNSISDRDNFRSQAAKKTERDWKREEERRHEPRTILVAECNREHAFLVHPANVVGFGRWIVRDE